MLASILELEATREKLRRGFSIEPRRFFSRSLSESFVQARFAVGEMIVAQMSYQTDSHQAHLI